jgi:hypothetical protein
VETVEAVEVPVLLTVEVVAEVSANVFFQ